MLLNISSIIYIDGGRIPFDLSFDFSEFDFFGERPVSEPVIAKGEVINRAGALTVVGSITTTTHPTCDRCAKPLVRPVDIPIDAVVVTEFSNDDGEDDNVFLLTDGSIDMDELVSTVFVLNLHSKNLCSDDCKGLCPGCGADLNSEQCRCKKEIDPRLAALSQLLKDKEN